MTTPLTKLIADNEERLINIVLNTAFPIIRKKALLDFAKGMPLGRLEKILVKHHDEYGDFHYAACAKEIKAWMERAAIAEGKE